VRFFAALRMTQWRSRMTPESGGCRPYSGRMTPTVSPQRRVGDPTATEILRYAQNDTIVAHPSAEGWLMAEIATLRMTPIRTAHNDTVTNQNDTVGTSIIRLKRCQQHESMRMSNERRRRRQIQMEESISSHLPPLVSDLCPDPPGR